MLFDFDGTLTQPGTLDFPALRKVLDCPPETPILEFIMDLPAGPQREQALAVLDRFEMEGARHSLPNAGAETVVEQLLRKNLQLGIISRNRCQAILRALDNFQRIRAEDFHLIISRDDKVVPKPDPAGIRLAARRMGVTVQQTLIVGDFWFDVKAGQRAGARTVLLTNGSDREPESPRPSFTIVRLEQLLEIVDERIPLSSGKLPLRQLQKLLTPSVSDPSVLIGPGVGEDVAAVVAASEEEVLVLKSDPITFATDQLAYYAVVVNANDIATSGATPRWLLTTLLFPTGSIALQVRDIVEQLRTTCREIGVTLCGGHTEITDSVTRPIVVGQIVGTVTRGRLVEKRQMHSGDQILLTKGLAIEGTSIISREFSTQLRDLGMSSKEVERCRRLLTQPGISIMEEAKIAADSGCVSAMHDVTEGGIRTALEELSIAGWHRLQVSLDRIPILPVTRKICRFLGLSPWGLIASGSLLLTCQKGTVDRLIQKMAENGISATCIGRVMETGSGVEALDHNRQITPWPAFEVDEITRLYAEGGSHSTSSRDFP